MRVLQYTKPREAAIVDKTTPRIGEDQALGRNLVSNVSAGTEMAFYRGTAPQINSTMRSDGLWEDRENSLAYPMASSDPDCWWMGYASVVEIVEVGAGFGGGLKVGDIVFTPQGHKEFHLIEEGNYQKVPKGLAPEVASFKTLTEIAYNGFLDAKIKLLDNVVLFGMGTIGQLLVQMCKMAGANVVAVDVLDSRLELAAANGADVVVNPLKCERVASAVFEAFGGPADAVVEVSGNSSVLNEAVCCVKKDGQVTVLSFYQDPPANFMMGREFHHNRVVVRSSQIGGISPGISHQFGGGERSANAMALLGKMDVSSLITHRCSFGDYPDVIKTIDENPAETLSVVIEY